MSRPAATAVASPISATTRVFALLGDPVAHSVSPAMQNAAFAASQMDAIYVALRCDASTAPALARGLAFAGGGGNVTVPHKTTIAACLDVASEAVRHTGACNTFWLERGRLCGENTDVIGFRAAADELLGSCRGLRSLIVGAGGAARAAVAALAGAGAADIALVNRSPARAASLCNDLAGLGRLRVLNHTDLQTETFDLVVNATPLGLRAADPLPLDLRSIRRVGAALDLVTTPGETAWTAHARALGARAAGGATMLLAQGAAAFACWWQRPAPVAVMKAALNEALNVPVHHGDAR